MAVVSRGPPVAAFAPATATAVLPWRLGRGRCVFAPWRFSRGELSIPRVRARRSDLKLRFYAHKPRFESKRRYSESFDTLAETEITKSLVKTKGGLENRGGGHLQGCSFFGRSKEVASLLKSKQPIKRPELEFRMCRRPFCCSAAGASVISGLFSAV